MSSHDDSCLCTVCTCGRHKLCKPVRLSDAPIDANTEYASHFLSFPTKVVRGRPAPQELSVGGEFFAGTESREKFVLHTLPPRYKIVKPEYIPSKAKLESLTTQIQDYQSWPGVTPPKRRQQAKWQSTSGTFDGTTTTKSDYVEMPLPTHFVRQQQKYVKSEDKMDGISTQSTDYKNWGVLSVPTRRKATQAPPQTSEDRDFKSTSIASYVGHTLNRQLVKAPQTLTTDVKTKFEGSSVAKDAYKQWALPPRYQRHKAEYTPSPAAFDATTNYKVTFVPKTAERYIHPTPVYVPNLSKFDGKSTNKTDYLLPGATTRAQDFRPRNVYQQVSDDRDFVSTMRGQHTPKPLPHCVGADWMKMDREQTRDGHVHLKKAVVNAPAQ